MARPYIFAEKNETPEKIDIPFVLLTVFMCGLGLATLYSASLSYAGRLFDDPLYFVKRQALNLAVSIAGMIFFASISLNMLRKLLPQIIVITLILCILTFVPGIGITKNGASRWIGFSSFNFQPSELAKMVLVLFLANLFAKKHDRIDEFKATMFPASVVTFVFVFIVYLQNDFSTAIFILLAALAVFFVAGVKVSWFIKLCVLIVPFVALMILTEEYRVIRVLSFLHPERDPLGAGYQVNAALDALAEGGFWGRGLGNGIKKISSIPEVQSDFIFTVWAEEMGFLGVLIYFTMLILFSLRSFGISMKSKSRFGFLLGFGCSFIILFQSLMNIGVVVRAFPATGIPLPFFSSGGSSLLITLCICGLLINISRNKTGEETEDAAIYCN
ncbi:putative lipid II flippase FtsW [Brucepastera parasyntrophica]|uniref:putative lipid II flippase FtsW n=1 Tax=Brucepastera parasyntrophica TaxID=2880008 RepID=UPI00210B9981|nr:putative lipid II flippase FtsW [Brucepastera parasyntrophica]ULQ60170.1 putative lipid II flippase FtsW [Brucepastera parasyntrophica]